MRPAASVVTGRTGLRAGRPREMRGGGSHGMHPAASVVMGRAARRPGAASRYCTRISKRNIRPGSGRP
jgi:hypothetical protein